MLKRNYHTHTYRCQHASGNDEQFVQAAIDAGIEVLGFSDHMPTPKSYDGSDRMSLEELPGYLASINKLKDKYKDKIEILVGFECEWLFDEVDFLKDLKAQSDYLILAQHERFIHNDRFDYTFYANDADFIRYGDELIMGIESGLFSILCHPEYPLLGRNTCSETCELVFHRICKACELANLPIELNLKGFEKKVNIDGIIQPVYPFKKFWDIASEYDIKAIYGIDAHRPKDMFRGSLVPDVEKHLANDKLRIVDRIIY